MRIIGGQFRGRRLASLPGGTAKIRPTSDRVRTVMFDLLMHSKQGNLIDEARVLDLFAGTGALGLEALSRGAEHALFVDHCPVAHKVISHNIAQMDVGEKTTTLRRDTNRLGTNPYLSFSLLLLDPPYEHSNQLLKRAIHQALRGGWIVPPNGFIVTETPSPVRLPELSEPVAERQVGLAWIGIFRSLGNHVIE